MDSDSFCKFIVAAADAGITAGSNVFGEVMILLLLVFFSGFFSASETALNVCSRVRLKNLASDGNRRAKRVLRLTDNYDSVLSAILIGNNIVNLSASALASVLFFELYGDIGISISTAVITLAVLIFGEVTPKSFAKDHAEDCAMFCAPAIRFFTIIFYPLSLVFLCLTKLVARLSKKDDNQGTTEDELIIMVEEAESGGGIDAQESELIKSAIEFGELTAIDILTPRVDIVGVDIDSTYEETELAFHDSGYSRLPVYDKSIDNIVGVITQKDFVNTDNESRPLRQIMKEAIYIVPSMKISKILSILQHNKTHMAVVTDEYGGTNGIVTMEDILEELVGEIWDEHDDVVEDFRRLDEDEYVILCSANLEKMFELIDKRIDEDIDIPTVGGWVSENLDKIPEVGDSFSYDNLEVRVTKANSRRAIEILLKVLPVAEEE